MTKPLTVRQNPDIKYLGKLLGDVIRSYGGEDFIGVLNIFVRPALTWHRGVADADAIDPGLDALSLDETTAFVRGFMLSRCSPIWRKTGKAWPLKKARAWWKLSKHWQMKASTRTPFSHC